MAVDWSVGFHSTRGDVRVVPTPVAEVKLLAIDVDGTLLDRSGCIRPRVSEAIAAAMSRGCEVVLATGRRLQSVEPIAVQLGISTVIMTDGTVVFDLVGRRAIHERALAPDLVRRAVILTVDAELSPIIYQSPAVGGLTITGPVHLEAPEAGLFLGRRADVRRLPIADLESIQDVIAIIAIGVEERVDRLAALGGQHGGFSMIRWYPSAVGYHHHTVTFAPPETSKGHALRWLAAQRGIPIESTMAIGDYENDVSLVSAAGIGIAMGNATASVKRVAREVVADNENDGVSEAIQRWILARL